MAQFDIENLPSGLAVRLVGEISGTTVNPTVTLVPASRLTNQLTSTIFTEIPLSFSIDKAFEGASERMWLTGGTAVTTEGGDAGVEYTAIVRGLKNTNINNPPIASDGATGYQFDHKNNAACAIDETWLVREMGQLFSAASTVTLPKEAGENVSQEPRAIVQDTELLYAYQSGKTAFKGVNTEPLVAGQSYSLKTYGARVSGMSGLAVNGVVYADYVAPGGSITDALAGAGAGVVEDGDHDYIVTFVTAQGETSAGTASAGVTVADQSTDGQVSLTAIPVSANANVTSRKIYRRFNATGDYKLVTTIADNTTTTYTDNTANASLGAVVPTENTNNGIITQLQTVTSLEIGVADDTTSFIITRYPAQNSTFSDTSAGLVVGNILDATKTWFIDLAGKTTSTFAKFLFTGGDQTITFPEGDFTVPKASDIPILKVGEYVNSVDGGVTEGQALFVDTVSTSANAIVAEDFGRVASNVIENASPRIGNGLAMTTIKLKLQDVGSPTDNMEVRIETDSAGTPSGTLFDPNATGLLPGSATTNSWQDLTFTLDGSVSPVAGTKYWVLLKRTGGQSDTDYFQVAYQQEDSFFQAYRYTTAWNAVSDRRAFFEADGFHTEVLSLTDTTYFERTKLFGFATETTTRGAVTDTDISGVTDTQTGLSAGENYFLTNTPGAIVAADDGRDVYSVGLAVSDTKLKIETRVGQTFEYAVNLGTNRTANTTVTVAIAHELRRTPEYFDIEIGESNRDGGTFTGCFRTTQGTKVKLLGLTEGQAAYSTAAYKVASTNNFTDWEAVGIENFSADDTFFYYDRVNEYNGAGYVAGTGSIKFIIH